MPKLTKSVVDRAEPRSKQFTIWDSELKGFGVYVQPSGSRTYFIDYRTSDGGRRRMTIGRHGTITTEQARKLAIETLGGVVLQKADPLLEKRTRRASLTISELCDDYIAAAEKGLIIGKGGRPKKPSTIGTDKGRIERHIKPLLGRKLVIDLKSSDVAKFIRDVTAGKTALVEKTGKLRGKSVVDGGAGTASRTTGLLGGILSYAVSEGIRDSNPAHGVKRPTGGRRERRLTADEYAAFHKALVAVDQDESSAVHGPRILRFLALTGSRLSEALLLRWGEVDFDLKVLRLGDTKEGRSIRPLGAPAVDLLASFRPNDLANVYVFPSDRNEGKPYGGIRRFHCDLFEAAGLPGVTPHVLRHSFASVGADLGFTDSTIGACLGHSGSGITSRYTHRLDAVLIAAADKIAGEIDRQMRDGGTEGD